MSAAERLSAALAGRYRIEREVGSGGMATVYLAQDLKHDRKVALKVLKPELAAVLGAERFVVEIKTTASLQHPHILPLFDSGSADGYLFYVMPYVPGETLRERLDRETQLGVEESVRIATDVADALDYAHRQGVIHRDIKPENILLHDGRPMVADFGIALAVSAAAGGRMTETGLSLGTPHYMSPEQATADKDLSARSDIYSLASVLYEMLTGNPPHVGASAQQIIMKIVTEEAAPVTAVRRAVPPHVAAAVAKALEKLPADRFESAKAFAEALGSPSFTYGASGVGPGVGRSRSGSRWVAPSGWIAAAVLAAGMLWLATRGPDAADAAGFAFAVETLGEDVTHPVIAGDGSVYFAVGRELRVRRRDALQSELVHRLDPPPTGLAISPDGRWLAFVGAVDFGSSTTASRFGSVVAKISVDGGSLVPLITDSSSRALSSPVWSDDGWIYFEAGDFVARVPEGGGAVDTVLVPGHFHPQDALPGGRVLLLSVFVGSGRSPQEGTTVALDLRSGDTVTVAAGTGAARWSPTGHVILARDDGSLVAVPFDPDRFEATGPPQPVREGAVPEAAFALSSDGMLVYNDGLLAGPFSGQTDFWWLGLDGSTERIPLEGIHGHTDGDPSPDGTRIAYIRDGQVHVFDLDLGSDRQVGEGNHDPVWSPDGREIAFRADRRSAVLAVPADGSGEPRVLAALPRTSPQQWLSDGTVLVESFGEGDIRAVDANAAGTPPRDLFVARWNEDDPAVSPDGRWVAYRSAEDGTNRAYLRSWPALRGKTLVSGPDTLADGRRALFWSADSRTLLYVMRGGVVVGARIETGNGVSVPARSVVVRTGGAGVQYYDSRRERFLIARRAAGTGAVEPGTDPEPNRLVVVPGWFGELRRRTAERP